MKKENLLFRVIMGGLFVLPLLGWAQCPNLNFSMGNLTNWQCYAGSCANGNYFVAPTAPIPGKHTIMNGITLLNSGQFYDENCNKIPKVPDGYLYSCRIGNSGTGAEVDGIEYEITVDSNNSLLILSYACVLENPGHFLSDQPRFTMGITDSAGRVLSTPCANIIGGEMDGLVCETGSLVARTWTSVGYDLTPMIGQKVKIYFETWDCTLSGHFGYAYVVAECRPMKIELMYCAGLRSESRLRAPVGFISYTWKRSSDPHWADYTRQIIVADPLDGEIFTCTVKSELGCESELKTVIAKTQIHGGFFYGVKDGDGHVPLFENYWVNWYDTCTRTATFVECVSISNSTKQGIVWEIDGLPNVQEYDSLFTYTFPEPKDNNPVTYTIRLTVYTENGCPDMFSQQITIYPSPKVKIAGDTLLCTGMVANLTATPLRSQFTSHEWSWVKNNGDLGHYIGDTLKINETGIYYLTSLDVNRCYAYDTLIVKPLTPKLEGLAISHIKCWGEATGLFQYSVLSGGQLPYQTAEWIVWRNDKLDTVNILSAPEQGKVFWGLPAGRYTFYAIDNLGCELRDTVHILQPDILGVFPTPQKTSCAKDNGEITFKIIGGTPPYTVFVNETQSMKTVDNVTFKNLKTGIYTAKVVDNNGCKKEGIEVEILALPQYTITGKITFNGNPLSGVFIETNNSVNICNSASTDMFGEYTLSVDSAITVILTPLLANYEFTPSSCTYFVTNDLFNIDFVATSTVGIEQLQVTGYELQVYPNPTNGQLTINNEQLTIHSIEIYNTVGQLLLSFESLPSLETTVNISHLTNGIYFLKINNKVVKVIKN